MLRPRRRWDARKALCLTALLLVLTSHAQAAWPQEMADALRRLDPRVATAPGMETSVPQGELYEQLERDIRLRRNAIHEDDQRAWRALRSREDWERFKSVRIAALRRSLESHLSGSTQAESGHPPDGSPHASPKVSGEPRELRMRSTRQLTGDGFRIDCVAFETRPGLWVTANLYSPAPPRDAMPGLLICHSHHNPKTQGELQDMGVNWARAGCLVLVMDQIGHGERRQHPFRTQQDHQGNFQLGRQDYYFRYNVGMQLHLAGESLLGWMVGDLQRGVDLLLAQSGIDPERIILLGAVAGGGDPCAVAAALDTRITLAVPFNFGGPQPENVFPLPDDTELNFNYMGSGSWESTRNLRRSGSDGFLPWVIVGSIAPRRVIYAHEFSWDRHHDPVWRRLQTIYGWYGASDALASLHGYGRVQLPVSEASHCNNIGAFHRQQIYPPLQRWFAMPPPVPEFQDRRDSAELLAIEDVPGAQVIPLRPVRQVAAAMVDRQLEQLRQSWRELPPKERRAQLVARWADVLGYEPPARFEVMVEWTEPHSSIVVRKLVCRSNRFVVPLLLLSPDSADERPRPWVVGVAQEGKAAFLQDRSNEIVELLQNGIGVCLPDLPGCGELGGGGTRGRRSVATSISSTRLMLGGTIVGDRLAELLALLGWLRTREDVDARRIAIWGDSFANSVPAERSIALPLDIAQGAENSEPLGAMLALLSGLFDPRLSAVLGRGSLVSFRSVLDSPFVHVPHDVIVPGAMLAGDLPDVGAALAPTPVRIEGLVDGTNRRVSPQTVGDTWHAAGPPHDSLQLSAQPTSNWPDWLMRILKEA